MMTNEHKLEKKVSEIGWDQTSSLAKLDGTKRPVWQKWHGIKCPWDQLSRSRLPPVCCAALPANPASANIVVNSSLW